jgi:hypothetical protein
MTEKLIPWRNDLPYDFFLLQLVWRIKMTTRENRNFVLCSAVQMPDCSNYRFFSTGLRSYLISEAVKEKLLASRIANMCGSPALPFSRQNTLKGIRSKVTGIIGFELLTLVVREQNDFQKK